MGGIAFEHDAIMKLIAERCRRLLVVVTPSFLQSPANKFFVTFAQALGIGKIFFFRLCLQKKFCRSKTTKGDSDIVSKM